MCVCGKCKTSLAWSESCIFLNILASSLVCDTGDLGLAGLHILKIRPWWFKVKEIDVEEMTATLGDEGVGGSFCLPAVQWRSGGMR